MEKLNVLLLGSEDKEMLLELFEAGNIESDIIAFSDNRALEDYLALQWVMPDVIFIKIEEAAVGTGLIADIRKDCRYDSIIIVAYAENPAEGLDEEVFIAGANVYIRKESDPDFRKKIFYILGVIWQYIADGFNKETFMLMVN